MLQWWSYRRDFYFGKSAFSIVKSKKVIWFRYRRFLRGAIKPISLDFNCSPLTLRHQTRIIRIISIPLESTSNTKGLGVIFSSASILVKIIFVVKHWHLRARLISRTNVIQMCCSPVRLLITHPPSGILVSIVFIGKIEKNSEDILKNWYFSVVALTLI